MFLGSLLPWLVLLIPTVCCIKCHITDKWWNTTVVNTTEQECYVPGSITCVKVVDLVTNTYAKSCSSAACNGAQGVNVSQCTNNTVTNKMECCCTGDGCNSSPLQGYSVIFYWPLAIFLYGVFT